jgi:hypothetical protein
MGATSFSPVTYYATCNYNVKNDEADKNQPKESEIVKWKLLKQL